MTANVCNLDTTFDRSRLAGTSCAFGVFDGVHAGHRFLIGQAQRTAAESGGRAAAITFDIDPDELFHAQRLRKLQTNDERIAMLAESGVDDVFVLPFTRDFAAEEPRAFLDATFGAHAPAYLHVGADFEFGARASGRVSDLEAWARQSGTRICAHELLAADGKPVTATRIRMLLADGDVEGARKLLGRPWTLTDTVRQGRQEGRDLGFRTANLKVPAQRMPIAEGVYACRALVGGLWFRAAVSVGVSPVFEATSTANCEVHLLDFEGDLYGRPVTVEFLHWLRPMVHFESVEELVSAVQGNIEWVRRNVALV